jgi:DGQHR domain-containing protein
MPAADAIAIAKVDEWDAVRQGEDGGYQRAPSGPRVGAIAAFLKKSDSVLPVGGLLNARSSEEAAYGAMLLFEADEGEHGPIRKGWLTIPQAARPLWIVDMQHRIRGLERAIEDGREDLRSFPVTFTIADGLSKLEEITQFEVINTTQKKVRTDLARRLMAIQARHADMRKELDATGRLWQAWGSEIADWLNAHGAQWKGKITPPNSTKADAPEAVIPETSFVTSLKPILQTPYFRMMGRDGIGDIATFIDEYWQAIALTFPAAFKEPTSYVIQKTPGVFSLHSLAPEIVERIRSEKREVTVDELKAVIAPWRSWGHEYWSKGNPEGAAMFGSMKGFAILAAELREALPAIGRGLG